MEKIVLITGATSGIGRAVALKLAEKGYNLILAGRRMERLNELSKEIELKYDSKVLPLSFDIRMYKEVEDALLNKLPKEWSAIDVLINNAGLGLSFGPIHEGQVEDWDMMIDTNIKGLLYATRVVAPGMVERKIGHIINIGSAASRQAAASVNVYSATKYAVDGLSKNMRLDLLPHGVRVTQILPARVKTEFALVSNKGNQKLADESYDAFTPLDAENVADAIIYALAQPAHVNIQDVLMISTQQK